MKRSVQPLVVPEEIKDDVEYLRKAFQWQFRHLPSDLDLKTKVHFMDMYKAVLDFSSKSATEQIKDYLPLLDVLSNGFEAIFQSSEFKSKTYLAIPKSGHPPLRMAFEELASVVNIFKIVRIDQLKSNSKSFKLTEEDKAKITAIENDFTQNRMGQRSYFSAFNKGIYSYCEQRRAELHADAKVVLSDVWMRFEEGQLLGVETQEELEAKARKEIMIRLDEIYQHFYPQATSESSGKKTGKGKEFDQFYNNEIMFYLGVVVGHDLLKNVAKKYGINLQKPGLEHKEFRELLLGAAVNYTENDPLALPENQAIFNKILRDLPIPVDSNANANYADDVKFLEKERYMLSHYPTKDKIEKRAGKVTQDIVDMIKAQFKTQTKLEVKPGSSAQPGVELRVDAKLEALLLRLEEEYPSLSMDNLAQDENFEGLLRIALLNFNNTSKFKEAVDKIHVFIANQLEKRRAFARSEWLGHAMAYTDLYSRDGHVVKLPNEDHALVDFEVQGVIRDENGLGMAIMTQTGDIPESQGVIPIIITFPGTHDGPSGIRDLDDKGAGTSQYDPSSKEFKRMLEAVNTAIKAAKDKYGPDKKVSIEIFGHSLGGADTYNFTLAILQAMSQNAYNQNQANMQIYADTRSKLQNFDAQSERLFEEHTACAEALSHVVGNANRVFPGTINTMHPTHLGKVGLAFDQINLGNIAMVSANANNSAGIHNQTSYSLHAAAAYLGQVDPNKDNAAKRFKIKSHTNMTNRDVVQKVGHTRDFAYAARGEGGQGLFEHVDVNLCGHYTMRVNELKEFMFKGRVIKLEAHTNFNLDNVDDWLTIEQRIYRNDNAEHQRHQSRVFNKKVSVLGMPLVESSAYTAAKGAVHGAAKTAYAAVGTATQAASAPGEWIQRTRDYFKRPPLPQHQPPLIKTYVSAVVSDIDSQSTRVKSKIRGAGDWKGELPSSASSASSEQSRGFDS